MLTVDYNTPDVLGSIPSLETESELLVIRARLADHIRLAPETTLKILMEYTVSSENQTDSRGDLMDLTIPFLLNDRYEEKPVPLNKQKAEREASSEGQALPKLRQMDQEGGKGAILEVVWLQRNAAAEAILLDGCFRVGIFQTKLDHISLTFVARFCH